MTAPLSWTAGDGRARIHLDALRLRAAGGSAEARAGVEPLDAGRSSSGHGSSATRTILVAALLALALAAPARAKQELTADGGFSCDFELHTGQVAPDQLAGAIERDRMYQSARPGFQRKLIPIRNDLAAGPQSGGRYLFDTELDARRYRDWLTSEYALDGTRFFDRPIFGDPRCYAWRVIGATDLQPVEHQVLVRTERFRTPTVGARVVLELLWPLIRAEALERQLTGVWLLYSQADQLASLAYFADRPPDPAPNPLDAAAQTPLGSDSPLGQLIPFPRVFDRTEWVLTRWSPFVPGDHGQPSAWPNSPPLPVEPTTTDGICEPSRGETSATAPADCLPTCGNAAADAQETTLNCPSDIRPFKAHP
jgi:hypothetical protein